MSDWILVSFDTDRIKEYVFGTARLREIEGASALLDDLNRKRMCEKVVGVTGLAVEDVLVYANGGSGLFKVPSKWAEDVIIKVEQLYAQETVTGSITGVYRPYDEGQPFGDQVKALSYHLRRRKQEKAAARIPRAMPLAEFCASCGLYPASHFDTSITEREDRLCESCRRKRQVKVLEEIAGPWGRLADHIQRPWVDLREMLPRDLESIGQVSSPPGYIGYIYADGNSFGQWLTALNEESEFRSFATKLDQILCQVTFDALLGSESLKPQQDTKEHRHFYYPFDILLLGGDDIVIVTPADAALPLALRICQDFEEQATEELKQPLTLSAGVVLAHASFPIRSLFDLAEELVQSAKNKLAPKAESGTIDFMVITDPSSQSVEQMREQLDYASSSPDRLIRLTDRPYTLAEMRKLLCQVARLKKENFPRNRLQFLVEGIDRSETTGTYHTAMVYGRLRESEHRKRQALAQLFIEPMEKAPPVPHPWFKQGVEQGMEVWATRLLDAVELYRFVPTELADEPECKKEA